MIPEHFERSWSEDSTALTEAERQFFLDQILAHLGRFTRV